MFTMSRSNCVVGTGKKRSLSESRGVQIGGGHLQQKTLGRSWDRSVRQVDHIGGVFTNRGFTVLENGNHRHLWWSHSNMTSRQHSINSCILLYTPWVKCYHRFLTTMIVTCIGGLCWDILATHCSTARKAPMVTCIPRLSTRSAQSWVRSPWLASNHLWQYQSTGRLVDANVSSHAVGAQSVSDGERYQLLREPC